MARTRALYKLKATEKCPGEKVCTSDRINGPCARMGRSLDEFCRPVESGCKLYWTKDGVIPLEYRGMMQAVSILRAKEKAGLEKHEHLFPYWAIRTYLLANQIFMQIEMEQTESDDDQPAGNAFAITGKGDSGAFKDIFEYMQEFRMTPRA